LWWRSAFQFDRVAVNSEVIHGDLEELMAENIDQSAADIISRYFTAQSTRDFDTLVDLFAADGVVIDEGKTWRGKVGIREWRDKAASVYQYTTKALTLHEDDEDEYTALVRLEGNFPGGIVELEYHFALKDGRIQVLEID
jgi:ketosteroid isomerase-like protein